MKTINIISDGICECVYEPRGNGGLEGYNLGEHYPFQRCENEGGEYIRVFPVQLDDSDPLKVSWENYYECCGTGTFKKHFIISLEKSIASPFRR